MKNTLPPFKTFQLEGHGKKTDEDTAWCPEAANPDTATYPFGIAKEFSAERKIEWRATDKFELAPNKKYAHPVYDDKKNPSPLGVSERGVAGPPVKIALPEPKIQINYGKRVEKKESESGPIVLNIYSLLNDQFDVFIRNESQMQSLSLDPYQSLTCSFVSSLKTSNDLFSMCVAPFRSLAVLMNDRQEIKEYSFRPGPIGLEVEERNGALVITGVVANSQASEYECYIGGLEVIAINGERVTSLLQFRNAVIFAIDQAQLQEQISGIESVICLAIMSYKSPKDKLDDLYNYNLQQKNGMVKGLLGNLVKTGIDRDHSHGIELPRPGDSSEEEEEEEVEADADDKGANENPKAGYGSGDKTIDDNGRSPLDDDKDSYRDGGTYLTETDGETAEMRAPRVIRATTEISVVHGNSNADSKKVDSPASSKKKKKGHKKGSEYDHDSDEEAVGLKSKQSWEYTTALDTLELSPYYKTVCLPGHLMNSLDWGNPSDVIAIGNFTRKLNVHVYWVDNDGSLVLRNMLGPGQKHLDYISANHVWVLAASKYVEQSKSKYGQTLRSGSPSKDGRRDQVGMSIETTAVMFRVSRCCLGSPMTFVGIWTPLSSLSFSQRAVTMPKTNNKSWQERIKERMDQANGISSAPTETASDESEPIPKINFQIFETSKGL